jgi:transaldolase/glucose-6-phosphate isomerase
MNKEKETMTTLHKLSELGQAAWFDFIRRSFTEAGDLQALIEKGVRGVTSNPAIFDKAIAGSDDYDADIQRLVGKGKSVVEIYEALAVADIQSAADLLRPLYDETDGRDGFVSLEVSPTLAHETEATITDAKRLFAAVRRPNVMIKIPATPEGIPAIERVVAAGISVNVTLIFSLAQYEAAAGAYIAGLETLLESGGALGRTASVASFFVSRVDAAVDDALEKLGRTDLQGHAAVDNARLAYARFQEVFAGERWEKLANAGARVQRPLWASTGTKNSAYPDTKYVDSLIGPDTVNTVPPATLNAFMNHGQVALTIDKDVEGARVRMAGLSGLGIDFDSITEQLLHDGVASFAKAFQSLMSSVEGKKDRLLAEWKPMSVSLGSYDAAVQAGLTALNSDNVIRRIWAGDHTVWKPDPAEITNRLGWLHIADVMKAQPERIESLSASVRNDGYTHALVMGMGGSSLAPEVFSRTFGVKEGFLKLSVLDSTDPDAVMGHANNLDLGKTLFIVSTKSGGTVEPLSFFKYFYNRVLDAVGPEEVGRHFVAITDPGSKLLEIAEQYRFRYAFVNDPNIGGRYSALSYFGLVPAALMGVDLETLLDRAQIAVCNAEGCNCPIQGSNNAARLGVILGELAKVGRDKVTFVASREIASFGDWVEQLIAESTGKEGHGILPVVGEAVGAPGVYGHDRVFVHLRMEGDDTYDATLQTLADQGHPVIVLRLHDRYDLGGLFFFWEMATAVAGACLGINPFDQPDVEAAKVLARKMTAAYQSEGKLPELTPALDNSGIRVYGDIQASTPGEALMRFLAQAETGAYIALQAYVPPDSDTEQALQELRTGLRDRFGKATTVGYGPRFLHSTGQMHKGDAGKGVFVQFTTDATEDIGIPDEAGASQSSMTFGTLKEAQALGDRQALLDGGRQVIRFHLGSDLVGGLRKLSKAVS